MRVLICGDRNWYAYSVIHQWVWQNLPANAPPSTVIHGDARGADRMAGRAAALFGHEVIAFPAQWDKHGKAAGYIRNQQMLDEGKPDLVVYFHDNLAESKGTGDMVSRARKAGIKVVNGSDL